MNGKVILILIILGLALWLLNKVMSRFKVPKVGSFAMVTGGVKAGKSTFGFYLAWRNYRRALFRWNLFRILRPWDKREKPLFYTNIPVRCEHVLITNELFERKKRFAYGSVIFIDEGSLVADSQLIRNQNLNEALMLFNKLIGHETHGGLIVWTTQAIQDLHYSVKRCTSQNFYVHHVSKWFPFFILAHVQETRYSDDGLVLTVGTQDIENPETLKRVIIPKRVWKKFDAYCYSTYTDDLPVIDDVIDGTLLPDLKVNNMPSFREFRTLKKKETPVIKTVENKDTVVTEPVDDNNTSEVVENEKKND